MKKTIAIIIWVCLSFSLYSQTNVSIDTTTTYQQINGWGMSLFISIEDRVGKLIQPKLIDLHVNQLGSNAYRWEIERKDWEDFSNDNSDDENINWSAFKSATCDKEALDVILPMKALVEAKGEKLSLYSSTSFFTSGSSGDVPEWMFSCPGEMSEWLISWLLYVKNKYSITIDNICIANEPDNGNRFTSNVVGNMIKVVGPRIAKAGLSTSILFPEHAQVDSALTYLQKWQNDTAVMNYIKTISTHLYFGTDLFSTQKKSIYNIAKAQNKTTAQTEYMGNTFNILYDDLVNLGVSQWYTYRTEDYMTLNQSRTSFTLSQNFWDLRQVLYFINPGSYRISASTTNTNTQVLAFKKNGRVTTICRNMTGGANTFNISGLPAGSYAINKGTSELGLRTVTAAGTLSITTQANEIITIYPHTVNLAPVATNWNASQSYILQPASTTNLNVTAVDPEGDPISYNWTVLNKPAGASVLISNPSAATTAVSGLTVAGEYHFAVTLSDGSASSVKELVPVLVVSSNQGATIWDVHNRIPVYMQLPGSTSTTLRASARDPESDALTLTWTVLSQPSGANATLTNANTTSCTASNMSVAGDYTFQFSAFDGTNTVTKLLVVTQHAANNAPVISSISSLPSSVTTTIGSATLKAVTSDANSDSLGYWWSVQSCPVGAKPIFTHQGRKNTDVTGLTIAGNYIFKLVAADNTNAVNRTITITVTDITTPSGNKNIALNKPVTADSENATYPASLAVDGDNSSNTSRWLSTNTAYPHWIEIDLQGNYSIDSIKFYTGWNVYTNPIITYQFQYWNGSTWIDIINIIGNASGAVKNTFATTDVSRVRLYATSGGDNVVRLFEIEVYGRLANTPVINVSSVSLNKKSSNLLSGNTDQLTATILPVNATNKNVTWSSSKSSVATVSTSGLITAVAAGNATITVTSVDGSKTDTCHVSVTIPIISVSGVNLNKSISNLNIGNTDQITATIQPANATNKNVTWSTDNALVATVSSSGLITANGVGSANIIVTTVDGSFKDTCKTIIIVNKIAYNKTEDIEISISPIPANTNLNIKINSIQSDVLKITILNPLGENVINESIQLNEGNNNFSFDVNSLLNGIYFINLNFRKKVMTKKIIIQKF